MRMSGIVDGWPAEYQHFIALLAETIEESIRHQTVEDGDETGDPVDGGDGAPAGAGSAVGVEDVGAPCEVPA